MSSGPSVLSHAELAALQALDTCAVANAIETFDERLRDEGYAANTVHCQFPQLGTMAGYAATSHNIIVHRIFRKTGARNVAHLTAMAVRNGWIK